METRASHSSPYFLRVAEANAASSASKITSLSTPFSFETASTTIKISLFITKSPHRAARVICRALDAGLRSGGKSRLANVPKRYLYLFFINFQRNPRITPRQKRTRVAATAGARHAQLNEHPLACEAREMRRDAQHPIETRR